MDLFRKGLLEQMERATRHGRIDVLINSGELYRALGGYPGSTHGMPFCCDAMEAEMKLGDVLLVERQRGRNDCPLLVAPLHLGGLKGSL